MPTDTCMDYIIMVIRLTILSLSKLLDEAKVLKSVRGPNKVDQPKGSLPKTRLILLYMKSWALYGTSGPLALLRSCHY
jgi:hypothetical protein